MSLSPETAVREAEPQTSSPRLPPLLLAAAGLTVLNGLVAVGFFTAWIVAPSAALAAVRGTGGMGLVLGLIGVGVGGWAQRKQKRSGEARASYWTTAAVLGGFAVMLIWLLIPMSAAVKSILATGP